MGNVLGLKTSKDAVLEIYELYAEKHACMAKAMLEDIAKAKDNDVLYRLSECWETINYIDAQIEDKLTRLDEEGKTLLAYKVRHALPLSSISPSRFLQILAVCGVEYED